ncbi:protein cramped isoform X2 [Copidosoma floridanum]|uniref:protein cramped isoform X2 n=1 Tax=Copidosoma floridanum TaxID=29053 RepID=UPI000C6FBE54|nr:protein cramped isoform X2 [Copidosoma floridanum]
MALVKAEPDSDSGAAVETGPDELNVMEMTTTTTVKDETNFDKEINSPIPSTSKAAESKTTVDSKNQGARIARGTKRMRDADSSQKDAKDDQEADAKITRSLKRSCELWSMEDKNTFFKALNEFGKDFDALQSYFLIQGKKQGLSDKMIKNKEQIRHFYYRTWLKISKHLKFSEDVKKTSQELYGLVNYGELRRKLPRIHEKVQMKLNELIYFGSTQVRYRKKIFRVKTPICRALRKLNLFEGYQEDIKLPSRVTLELRPANNEAWWHVQALSMNPRVRTLVPIQRRLSSILSYFQQRWRSWSLKIVPNAEIENLTENSDNKNSRVMRMTPQENCKITLPTINLGEYLTSDSICLNSYENRLGLKSSRVELLGSMQYLKGAGKKNVKKFKGDKRLSTRFDDVPDNSDIDVSETNVTSTTEKPSTSSAGEKSASEQPSICSRFPGRETIDRIRRGWNADEASTITVGDLYLMFGRDSKIILEYSWESAVPETSVIEEPQNNALSLTLQKLLSIAKHTYGTSKGSYDNVSGSSETVISSRVPSTKESTFIRPLIPPSFHRISAPETFRTQLDKYKSRYCRKGRTLRQRNLVVQRVLPTTPNVSYKTTITYPEVRNVSVGTKTATISPKIEEAVPQITVTIEPVPVDAPKHFLDVLDGQVVEPVKVTHSTASITSAMQILKEGEQQWLNSEVADFSLSSFLGQLESPVKSSQRSQAEVPMIEIIRPSSDVANMHCLMGENSVDYIAKFANFTSQITSSEEQKQ